MNDRDEASFIKEVRDHLDDEADHLDAYTRAGLRKARSMALGSMERPEGPPPVWRWWLSASLLVTAVLLVIIIQNEKPDIEFQLAELEDVNLLSSDVDLDLLSDMDFYQWLEERDHAG